MSTTSSRHLPLKAPSQMAVTFLIASKDFGDAPLTYSRRTHTAPGERRRPMCLWSMVAIPYGLGAYAGLLRERGSCGRDTTGADVDIGQLDPVRRETEFTDLVRM